MIVIWLLLSVVLPGDPPQRVDFDHQIIPILTKAGCNTGSCHGAAVGRGGLRLSLYGGDPAADYRALVHELEGRRVNLSDPDESLVLLKSTEAISHGGGYRLEEDGQGAALLRRWIGEGARRGGGQQLRSFRVSPRSHFVESPGGVVDLAATAEFSNGSLVDVTPWTVFTAEDPSSVTIDADQPRARVLRRGRQIIIARYLDHVEPIEVIVPMSDAEPRQMSPPSGNFIDDHVAETLATLRIPVSPPADDAAFLRRICLHLTGSLPSLAIQREFFADPDPHKREQWVDRLLASSQFTEFWTTRMANLLRVRSTAGDPQAMRTYQEWLRESIATAVPYDELVRELLMSSGDTHQVGPANFYRTVAGPRQQAELASELLMGVRLRCANCHNHPLDRWTQDDYHGLAALFANIAAGRTVNVGRGAEVIHPRTGEPARPRIPGESFLDAEVDGRAALASWLCEPDNPFFAKAIVNRLWQSMLGRGLVEPADDLRATNPATHPELLEALAKDFVDHDYDLRHTLRRIATSATYARGAGTLDGNETDDRFYSHALARPLSAEVLSDAISDVTGVAEPYGNEPLGTRAVALFDTPVESLSLDILGRCGREDVCESTTSESDGLSRMLHLFNGPLQNRKITAAEGRLARWREAGVPPAEVVDELYRRALGHAPSEEARTYWEDQFTGLNPAECQRALEDFLWSLLSCREFVTNH